MMGNGTYGLSVIVVLPALKGSKQTFIIKHLAWLIGSLGVLILDFFVSLAESTLSESIPSHRLSHCTRSYLKKGQFVHSVTCCLFLLS